MTKVFIKRLNILLLAVLLATLVGCNKGNDNIDKPDQTGISSKPTIYYSVNDKGEKIYYQEKYAEVSGVKNIVSSFCDTMISRSYKTVKGDEEYSFYTKELLDSLVKKGDKQETIDYYKKNSLEQKQESLIYKEIRFKNDFKECTVKVDTTYKIINASKNFLDQAKIKTGVLYSQSIEIEIAKVDNIWKVKKYSFSTKPQEIK